MNIRILIRMFTAVFLFAFILSAADKEFWSTKSYEQWSGKEVEKLLRNSPWSKAIHVSPQALGGRGGGGINRGAAPGSAAKDAAPDISAPEAVLYISWYARPIREALARRTLLKDPRTPAAEIQRILNYDSSATLDFVLTGLPAHMIFGADPHTLDKLKEETYLLKKNKVRIPAAAILQPGGGNQPIIFRFPRKADGGELITIEDKEVVLVTQVGGTGLRANFKLAEMIVNGKPAF